MSELPKGWVECLLDDVLISLESGSRPKGGVRNISEGVPSIGGEHLNYSGGFNFSNIRYVPKSFADKMAKGKIRRGDILVVKDGATTGKTSIVNEDFPFKEAAVNEHVFICRTSKVTNPKFVFRFLTSKHGQNNILSNFQGSAQGGINTKFVSNTIIPIAPLKEQKRIVEKLDKLLASVEEAKARLEKIPVIIKRFRQSVLNAAVTGELTKDWRERNKISIDDWDNKIFNEFCKLQRGYDLPLKKIVNGKYAVVTSGGIAGYHNEFKSNGPCLVTGRSGSVGNVHFFEVDNYWPHNTVLFVKDFCNNYPKFIYYFFLQFDFRAFSSSTAVPTLDRKKLFNELIIIPSHKEQKEIVKRVEALFKRADEIETRYKKAKNFVDKLTQSILAKAFRGELVPQDPNDPPASELLEKIKAEKELLDKSAVKGKRSRAGEPAEKLLERISAENKKEMKSRTK